MLKVHNLTCSYGDIVAARAVSFSVGKGVMLALIGANGAGKSSVLMCLCGLVAMTEGTITIAGTTIHTLPPSQRIHHGLAIVPEGRRIFAELSVRENLVIGGHIIDRNTLDQNTARVFDIFPRLKERQRQAAGSLSGGEQQMLAIGRALMSDPAVLLVDELSLGLMPKVVDECYQVLNRLTDQGVAIVLVEQNTERALSAADQVVLLEAGNVKYAGPSNEFAASQETLGFDPKKSV